MQVLIFDLRGSVAHYRRPDTMGTQATYPFITRTALRGLIASMLGLDMLPEQARCGLRLLGPVRTVAQELSMHGKSWVSG
ncbi:MAG: CRISPR-associated protein Cas5, partial [candidate division KSB1 bacterium]|nr:CRISPR-associated protein Cas5 [candidate division KSB1 bacterium]